MTKMNVKSLNQSQFLSEFENALNERLKDAEGILGEGMRYAMLDGGKRVRPLCVFLGARAVGKYTDANAVVMLALAIEFVHGYSLVHDDLPAMDNDDFRRGKLSVHKKFGYANGILIGDQLLTYAMNILCEGCEHYGDAFARSARIIARGAMDMANGQALDLQGCKGEEKFLNMYAKKTGALIFSAFTAGATIANADGDTLATVGEFAKCIGLSFQLADDILDVGEEGSIIGVIGEGEARAMLVEKSERACEYANGLDNAEELKSFVKMLQQRRK